MDTEGPVSRQMVAAIGGTALILGYLVVLIATFERTGPIDAEFFLEGILVLVPLGGLFLAARIGESDTIWGWFFVGIFLFGVHTVTELVGEITLLPRGLLVISEDLAALFGTFGILYAAYLWDRERTHAEALLWKREQDLEAKTEALELLNRLLRHDVRNDMTVAIGTGEYLIDDVSDDHAEYVRRIIDACEDVVALTTTAGEVEESVISTTEQRLEPIAVSAVVDAEVQSARSRFEQATIEFVDEAAGERVLATPMLQSVVGNLIDNAVKHNDEARPTVVVETRKTDDGVQLRVSDDGPGISDQLKTDVFEYGIQGAESSGTGLGLYLVRSLVTQFGGSIDIHDADPKGTVFEVTLREPTDDQTFS